MTGKATIFFSGMLILIVCISILFTLFPQRNLYKIPAKDLPLSHRMCVSDVNRRTHGLTFANGWEIYAKLPVSKRTMNRSEYWNEEERFRPFNMSWKPCTIIYCGANTAGTDGHRFAVTYPNCHIYFLEPVLPFYEELLHSSQIRQLISNDR